MKKILVILSVLFAASVVTSCQKPFEWSIPLALNNIKLTLPKQVTEGVSVSTHYIQVTSTGTWEAYLETESGACWCWLQDHYLDGNGNKVYIVEVLGYDEVGNINRVRGKGNVYLPMEYMDNSGDVRNALFTVERHDTGHKCVMSISQSK